MFVSLEHTMQHLQTVPSFLPLWRHVVGWKRQMLVRKRVVSWHDRAVNAEPKFQNAIVLVVDVTRQLFHRCNKRRTSQFGALQ